MKYDLNQFRMLYEKALGDSEINQAALAFFDGVVRDLRGSVDGLAMELASDPRFLHFCAGKATQLGHFPEEYVGDLRYHPDFITGDGEYIYIREKVGTERPARDAFLLRSDEAWDPYGDGYDTTQHQFEVSLRGSQIGKSYAFRMYWPDNTHDHRRGSYVEYALLVPNDEIADKVPRIADNPQVLFSTLRRVFPSADNSKGKLRFREGPRGIKLEVFIY